MSDVERRFADEEAEAVMAYARSRECPFEAQQEVQGALASLPPDPPQGVAVRVDEVIPEVPQHAQVQEGQPSSSLPSQRQSMQNCLHSLHRPEHLLQGLKMEDLQLKLSRSLL